MPFDRGRGCSEHPIAIVNQRLFSFIVSERLPVKIVGHKCSLAFALFQPYVNNVDLA